MIKDDMTVSVCLFNWAFTISAPPVKKNKLKEAVSHSNISP